jgi:NarL family two-component system response regulator LiaR
MSIRVLICDDQVIVREGLEMILSADKEIEVIGLTADGYEAIKMVEEKQPDIVLMDLKMPGMNGIRATDEIHKKFPDVKVLVLTTFGEDEWVFDAIRSGASGYLLKGTPRQELVAAVKGTNTGKTYIDPAVGGRVLTEMAKSGSSQRTAIAKDLSERELDVLKLLARGFSNAEIAEMLHLTKGTVRNYVSTILAKLGVNDRTQAAILAVNFGLAEPAKK